MKFDMGRAWNDALALLMGNKDVVLVVAGVFFFLPYFAIMLFLPQEMAALQNPNAQADPEKMMEMLGNFYSSYWWVFVLLGLLQALGMLGLMTLLTDRRRPTLGEALAIGAKYLPTYIAAQLLQGFAIGLIVVIPIALGAAMGSVAVAALLGLIGVIAAVYLFTKFSLASPVIAVEQTANPITALGRSWRMTKGNSLRIFGFYALLLVAFMVVSGVVSIVFGVGFALMGSEAAMIGNGFVSALVNAIYAALFSGILVAIHRQLSGEPETVSEAFE